MKVSLIRESLLHLLFPYVCEGCAGELPAPRPPVCLRCQLNLPLTHFHALAGNGVEKIFWGRLPLVQATAHYYFTKGSLVQRLLHHFKYRRRKELGLFLARQLGAGLSSSGRFKEVDALVPLPLYAAKEKKRGFNQAALLCEGIASVLDKPVWTGKLVRLSYTDSQTKKGRVERWQNMEGRFALEDAASLEGRHILLVDDVVTTGATLEAAGRVLLQVPRLKLSIAALCFAAE